MTNNRGIFSFLEDIVDAFFEEFDKSLAQNLYGENCILDESDIDLQRIFRLFKEPEKLQAMFVEYNKKTYRQNFIDPVEFINAYFKASSYTQFHQNDFKMKQFVYLFGIPVLLVEHLPWDDPSEDIVIHGCYNTVGIVCRESSEILDTVLHELTHAINNWLKIKGKFKLPDNTAKKISTTSNDPTIKKLYKVVNLLAAKVQLTIPDNIMIRFRDESIAYLMASPGSLSKVSSELAMKSLAGMYRAKVCEHFGDDIVMVDQLLAYIVKTDQGNTSISREQLSLLMYPNVSVRSIIVAINNAQTNN
jgi:hypothetical protein